MRSRGGAAGPTEVDDPFRFVASRLPVPVAVNAGGVVVLANGALVALLGATDPGEVEGRSMADLIHAPDRARVGDRLTQVHEGLQPEPERLQLTTVSGGVVPVEASPMPIMFEGGPAALVTFRDVTARTEAEEALRASEARWRALVQHGTDLIVVVDAAGRFTYVSPSARTILGREPDTLLGTNALDLLHEDDVPAAATALAARIDDPQRPHQGLRIRLLRGDGRWRWLETFASNLLDDPDVRGVIVNAWDVTEQVRAEAHLRHLASHDGLTGLPNRQLLAERLESALAAGRGTGSVTGLLMLDLDRFKDVNDTLGHESGDRVLAELAARLADAVREGDVVGRIGGDEFAVVLPDAGDAATVESVARRLLEACTEPVEDGGMQLRVGASIGMVLAPEHGDEPSLLLRRVDAAMYRAKDQRLGVVAAEEGDLDEGRRRLAAADELRLALERDELRCEYQPKVELATGRLVGVEALVRWQHPDRGLVGPDDFLPDAEQLGLMADVTRLVLGDALARLAGWTAAGVDLSLAVNVSASTLHDAALIPMVEEALSVAGVPPERLILEVTEQAAMVQPETSMATMGALRRLGVRFSIDDFGTGQSSLTYLRQLPATEVKIDRSFTADLQPGSADAAIVRTVVDLAHSLGLQAVVEGIDTAEVLELVVGFGCDLGQGWHLGRPVSGDEVPAVWRAALGGG